MHQHLHLHLVDGHVGEPGPEYGVGGVPAGGDQLGPGDDALHTGGHLLPPIQHNGAQVGQGRPDAQHLSRCRGGEEPCAAVRGHRPL